MLFKSKPFYFRAHTKRAFVRTMHVACSLHVSENRPFCDHSKGTMGNRTATATYFLMLPALPQRPQLCSSWCSCSGSHFWVSVPILVVGSAPGLIGNKTVAGWRRESMKTVSVSCVDVNQTRFCWEQILSLRVVTGYRAPPLRGRGMKQFQTVSLKQVPLNEARFWILPNRFVRMGKVFELYWNCVGFWNNHIWTCTALSLSLFVAHFHKKAPSQRHHITFVLSTVQIPRHVSSQWLIFCHRWEFCLKPRMISHIKHWENKRNTLNVWTTKQVSVHSLPFTGMNIQVFRV